MAEGIKLYKHFSDQISKIGRPKRAWFTTFNLDIHFFEKYILSALMDVSYKELKSPYDFEALNDQLANEQESLEEDRMEVRVFYDYRALQVSSKPKQTSVHIHSVDIKQLSGLNSEIKFTEGVFHPKVVLIETVTGEYWLMVSSANLTFGGWAKNRECFFCEKIEDTRIGRDVGLFFTGITTSIKAMQDNELLIKLNSGKFGQVACKWYFFSSFNRGDFLNQVNPSREAFPLKVWSPYFADNLDEILDDLIEEEYFDKIEIVPAKNEAQKIRITEEVYNTCNEKKEISFKQDKLPASANEAFVHAKVWLTPKALAIGSWNMTKSGMNISETKNNNVEAGIIYNISSRDYENILIQYPTSALRSPGHYTEDELKGEKEDVLDEYLVTVDLVADWDNLIIKLINPAYNKLISQVGADCIIQLPGIGKQKITILENDVSFREHIITLLTDRYFELENGNGKSLYKGYLQEIGLINRPVNSFENIDDYLKGWVSEMPEDKTELHRLAYKVEEDFGDELSQQTRKILMGDDQNAWFTSFHAFECIINRIIQTDQFYKRDRVTELKRIGRSLPGSLSELRKHLSMLKETYEIDNSNFLKSPIYLWFLIEKANAVFKYFNQRIGIQEENIRPIKNLHFESLFTKNQVAEIGKENIQKWMLYTKSKLYNLC